MGKRPAVTPLFALSTAALEGKEALWMEGEGPLSTRAKFNAFCLGESQIMGALAK